jgi:Zn-dependent protease with chaperone function
VSCSCLRNAIDIKCKMVFPQIELATLKKYDKSKLNLEDQWSSHPSDEDQIKALQQLNIVKRNQQRTCY